MKKFFSVSLSAALAILLTACHSVDLLNSETPAPSSSIQTNNDSTTIKNSQGTEFAVNLINGGEIIKTADGINSNKITIADSTFTMPIKFSDLLDLGWNYPADINFNNSFEPNQTTELSEFYLLNSNGLKLKINKVINNTSDMTTLENCLLGAFSIESMSYEDTTIPGKIIHATFTLPGGITGRSTASGVIDMFGTPYDSSAFASGDSDEDSLSYYNNITSKMSFSFSFEPDGSIKSVSVSYENQ